MNKTIKIIRLYKDKGLTYAQIGKKVKLSHEKVRQILIPFKNLILEAHNKIRQDKRKIYCKTCQKKFIPINSKIKYCSCFCGGVPRQRKIGGMINPYPRKTKEGVKWRYKMMKKYEYNQLIKYTKTAYNNLKNDPIRYKKYLKYQNEYTLKQYYKIKKDPKLYREYLNKRNIEQRKRYAKKNKFSRS